jgi:plasmid stability protein
MARIVIDNLDETIIERLEESARERRQSLEQRLRDILSEAVGEDRQKLVEEMRRCRLATKGKNLPDATLLIREDRDNDEPYR